MTDQNGIQLYNKGEEHTYPSDLHPTLDSKSYHISFKVVEINGKHRWCAGLEGALALKRTIGTRKLND
jgi:hypothetical protein